ncbi:hypothetical protein CC86DRAFT_368488 [Ophiobolus disseminans]|uniref:Uncharacterized protein n=1 Tax=Ophiobolus disseminans TaxID=1469910 RepID=A0A6A7A9U3_9PLEO|nr:hypothetical protein CC86DRAFT_368488 [Ophiobolus disseminans]
MKWLENSRLKLNTSRTPPMDSPPPFSTTASKFPFFSLAREVRDQIYHHLFSDTYLNIAKNQHIVSICYGKPHEPCDHFPAWLLLSKSTLSEGLAQFSCHAACSRITAPPSKDGPIDPSIAHHIHRDTLLLSSVREIRLELIQNCLYNHQEVDGVVGSEAFFVTRYRPKEGEPRYLEYKPPVPFDFRTRELVPALERLTLKIEVELFGWDGSPNSVVVSALVLRALGVRYKNVRFEVLPPAIQSIAGKTAPVAVIAAVYPRFHQTLHYLACLFTRGYDPAADGDADTTVDEAYWGRETWMPKEDSAINEFESSARRFSELSTSDRMHTIRDWINDETGAWNIEVDQVTEPSYAPYVSQACGLKSFTAPKLVGMPGNSDITNTSDVFKLDTTAKRGSASYSCASTGEMLWIQDKDKGVTGYMRDGEEAQFHEPPTINGFLSSSETAQGGPKPKHGHLDTWSEGLTAALPEAHGTA